MGTICYGGGRGGEGKGKKGKGNRRQNTKAEGDYKKERKQNGG